MQAGDYLDTALVFAGISVVTSKRSPDRALRSVALSREAAASPAQADLQGGAPRDESVLGDSHSH
jgi:hypothetical protein